MRADDLQRRYYTETASVYDSMHGADHEHFVALRHISSYVQLLDLSSILDVGCGTGRGIRYFLEHHAELAIRGVEPVQALIDESHRNGIPPDLVSCGRGEELPFEDGSFDAACEFGVLHHVEKPDLVVREMMRVASKAIFLSDSNRFGRGPLTLRWVKLLLYKLGLWHAADLLNTGGKGYRVSEGDGVSFSYSVFDSYELLREWADRVIVISTKNATSRSWLHPLLTTDHALLCAIRDG